jgi:DNA-binding MarR family transcriptional regulator
MPRRPPPRTPEGDIAFEILRSIRRILRQVSMHSRELSRSAGLTVPQLLCVRAIGRGTGEVSAADVSREVHLSAATVSRILDRLERDGLVRRERTSSDRRKVCLTLTDTGRERLAKVPLPLQDRFLDRVRTLPPAERDMLLRSLEQIVNLMEADDLDASPVLTPGHEVEG